MKGKKTYLGIAIVVALLAKQLFDVEIGEEEVIGMIEGVLALAGTVLAIYGRYNA